MKNFNKGFTLIELLVYIAIFAIILFTLISFLLTTFKIQTKNNAQQDVQANARIALDTISSLIRSAKDVNIGASTFGSDPGVLSLEMENAIQNPTVINLTGNDGILQIQEGISLPVAITSGTVKITNLQFTSLSPIGLRKNIRVQITLEYNEPGISPEFGFSQSLQTTINLRK